MKGYRRILVGVDGSPASFKAVREAVRLARAEGGHLTLLYVAATGSEEANAKLFEQVRRAFLEEGRKALDQAEEEVRGGDVPVRTRLEEGYPSDKILEVAESEGSDLIVVGSRGRSRLARMLLGSVASRVIAAAPCPVLAVQDKG